MNNQEKIKVGDLCLYYDIPVIVLEKREDIYYKLDSTKRGNVYLCLFHNGCDTVSGSYLIKV
jgi:hypothetical protein